ncbi:hypothetical protein LSUE1_G008789 [Lachnellula suecica]|uniref:MARVEL domain-containing protein n=1 Tax=Lachnellula suecica TaxID=602035 RepID=A0A8T9BZU8_9HELO|nr:hypothetical protein LSUE1_G008789 [Lachnellula suecica]
MSTTNHILPLPQAFLALRAVQLVVAIVILGLSAYVVTFIAFNAACLTLFTAIATMIITVYNVVSNTALKSAYNYWAILALDVFALIFWIISMAYLAWTTAAATWYYTDYSCSDYYYYCYKKRDSPLAVRATTDLATYRNSMAAAAGLGGLEFILFAITLIFTAIHLQRHRKAGGHSAPIRAGTGAAPAAAPAGVAAPAPVYSETKPEYAQQQYVGQPQVQQPVQYVQHPQTQQPTYVQQPAQQAQQPPVQPATEHSQDKYPVHPDQQVGSA